MHFPVSKAVIAGLESAGVHNAAGILQFANEAAERWILETLKFADIDFVEFSNGEWH